jgi:hypothetical protein
MKQDPGPVTRMQFLLSETHLSSSWIHLWVDSNIHRPAAQWPPLTSAEGIDLPPWSSKFPLDLTSRSASEDGWEERAWALTLPGWTVSLTF